LVPHDAEVRQRQRNPFCGHRPRVAQSLRPSRLERILWPPAGTLARPGAAVHFRWAAASSAARRPIRGGVGTLSVTGDAKRCPGAVSSCACRFRASSSNSGSAATPMAAPAWRRCRSASDRPAAGRTSTTGRRPRWRRGDPPPGVPMCPRRAQCAGRCPISLYCPLCADHGLPEQPLLRHDVRRPVQPHRQPDGPAGSRQRRAGLGAGLLSEGGTAYGGYLSRRRSGLFRRVGSGTQLLLRSTITGFRKINQLPLPHICARPLKLMASIIEGRLEPVQICFPVTNGLGRWIGQTPVIAAERSDAVRDLLQSGR
jgi:hypothetical protein